MKKNKLLVEYEYDFTLLAVVSNVREYKLAWYINKQLHINLVKEKDLHFNFINQQNLMVSNYKFATEHTTFRLLKNKSVHEEGSSACLIPELSSFDFLIMIQEEGDFFSGINVENTLKGISVIQYIKKIAVHQLKSKENLIF